MKRATAFAAGLVLLVSGCSTGGVPTPSFAPVEPGAVVAARKQAGIADCPESSTTVAARADGLPDLVLECLGGDSTVRLAGLRGKPMVINLWAQWCEPCREESPYLRDYAKAAGRKVLLLGVNYNDPRPELAVEFASLVGWKYPQLADQELRLATAMPVSGLPLTLFVDADGKVVHRVAGKLRSYDELVKLTEDHLGVTL